MHDVAIGLPILGTRAESVVPVSEREALPLV